MRTPYDAPWIQTLTKSGLRSLIADVRTGDEDAISRAVAFVCVKSFGMWHNRARAKLCRYFKNHSPSADKCTVMVDAVIGRLMTGSFFQQFQDQLTMAVRFAPERMADAAIVASRSAKSTFKEAQTECVTWLTNQAVPSRNGS